MATVNLHLTGVSLRRESLRAHGSAALVRQWVPLAIMLSAVTIVAASIAFSWPSFSNVSTADEFFAASEADCEQLDRLAGPLAVHRTDALATQRERRRPFSRPSARPRRLARELCLGAAVRRRVRGGGGARRRAASGATTRRTGYTLALDAGVPPPFRLKPVGRPEVALLWKNLILSSRAASWGVFWRTRPNHRARRVHGVAGGPDRRPMRWRPSAALGGHRRDARRSSDPA